MCTRCGQEYLRFNGPHALVPQARVMPAQCLLRGEPASCGPP
jgi:hypothetical protein